MSLHMIGPGKLSPNVVNAVVEIPYGSRVKYEIDHVTSLVKVDRVLYSPLHYPAEYGFIPHTLAPDGDPCDILVLIVGATYPGTIIEARPIGILRMSDDKGQDDKILSVALTDPNYMHVQNLADLPPHLLREVEHFFLTYKNLEAKDVVSRGWQGKEEALEFIEECIQAYRH
ncbi:inorganic diphosphatase [Mesoterricola sediminis]|uniref:Inorganic pyrophosphatase n=1 Tax=Mesoterricola sediminis TaxID=2927980 RepID=A0AA48KFQ5_9BACT|nr:inorganic diphosphatase [Mesoterricola sediminis]BDU76688.1 inorganic pyrophosphatase [Mesoterricola sediminis]